ncbi:MAG: hypothetical protein RJA07_455 [Bacteroidota bacterium]|jgi:hypothetical protein
MKREKSQELELLKPFVVPEKITIEKMRTMLNKDGLHYTDDELITLRTFIYQWAEIIYREFRKQKVNQKINILNQYQYETESNSLHENWYKRAS